MANKIKYTENDRVIVSTLKGNPEGLTLAELNEITGLELKPGSLTGAAKKGLIEVIGERDITRKGKREVTVYSFITAEPQNNAEGKPFNYTDSEKNVLTTAQSLTGEFKLADLANAMGVEKLSSGSINGLVKKGNIAKNPEKVKVECDVASTVNVYGFKMDIPSEA